ncbi:MAG: biotin--[acetyl-CoA-carboxylase] ligase [Chloroflexia bacterium]|nr:biotin--[acetyl-CoA-carboxylase] ligase [Chloroflexia bacterium]
MTRNGWVIHRYGRVSSTMDVAAHLAQFGATDRTVVVSDEQSAGRGRSGRVWESPAATALFCTLLLRPGVAPDRLSTLPLVAGAAVAEAIECVAGCPARLKWPNDVWLGADDVRRKVAGILLTSFVQGGGVNHVLLGIGINIAGAPETLPPGATSIEAATGLTTSVEEVLTTLLDRFDPIYANFQEAGGRPSLDGWRTRAALIGELVTIADAGRNLTGLFSDIDADGALLLEGSDGAVRRVFAGDLTRGPRPDAPLA